MNNEPTADTPMNQRMFELIVVMFEPYASANQSDVSKTRSAIPRTRPPKIAPQRIRVRLGFATTVVFPTRTSPGCV